MFCGIRKHIYDKLRKDFTLLFISSLYLVTFFCYHKQIAKVNRLKKSDLELEFELKLKEYKLLIYKVCRIYGNNPNDIQELYQDIIIQLWKSYPKFRGESKFSTWLYRIAINIALMSLSRPKRALEYRDVELHNLQVPDEDDTGLKDEQQEQMYLAIQQLNDIEKSIVMLYLEDSSYDEMEDILGISNATLRVKMNRIKEKLRTLTNNK